MKKLLTRVMPVWAALLIWFGYVNLETVLSQPYQFIQVVIVVTFLLIGVLAIINSLKFKARH